MLDWANSYRRPIPHQEEIRHSIEQAVSFHRRLFEPFGAVSIDVLDEKRVEGEHVANK